uniref:SET domain-containing protein n=1 Tax=Solanum lycopersicum TaxID=4081 RepID=K4BIQ0_SOLLC
MILRNQEKWVNSEWAFGHVPGVEIGDRFQFKVELAMVGLRHIFFRGIDYVNINIKKVATSNVDSDQYENETISSQKFIYVGQGRKPRVFVMREWKIRRKENIPILAINEIDNERPPPFTYITNMQYPVWYYIIRPLGCSCPSRCSAFEPCSCASKSRGEFPFNRRSSILEAKPLVHKCGLYCKCLPNCKNRVSQRGLGFHFEYFFDVGNYNEYIPKRKAVSSKVESNSFKRKDENRFTIDATIYENVGIFINHSCSPNLYAQNVMYDHGDKRVAHIMFFSSKSIYPLEELTYHCNHRTVHVHDTNDI